MRRAVGEVRCGAWLSGLNAALRDRLFPMPIVTVEDMGRFTGQRSAFVAQTSLYGYLKTRMGTKFPQYFEDEGFAASIRAAAERQFVSCAADLTIHAAAVAAEGAGLGPTDTAGLARHSHAVALRTGLGEFATPELTAAASAAFAQRILQTDWAAAAGDEAAFAGSIADLIRNAPVIDDFKLLDAAIVRNSIRFRWRDVRVQLRRRLDVPAIRDDWQSLGGA